MRNYWIYSEYLRQRYFQRAASPYFPILWHEKTSLNLNLAWFLSFIYQKIFKKIKFNNLGALNWNPIDCNSTEKLVGYLWSNQTFWVFHEQLSPLLAAHTNAVFPFWSVAFKSAPPIRSLRNSFSFPVQCIWRENSYEIRPTLKQTLLRCSSLKWITGVNGFIKCLPWFIFITMSWTIC